MIPSCGETPTVGPSATFGQDLVHARHLTRILQGLGPV